MAEPIDSLVQERFRTDDGVFAFPDLDAAIEALLIVATEPPAIDQLVQALEVDVDAISAALDRMVSRNDRGWIVQRHGATVQLTTAPRFALYVRRFLGLERETKLSPAALETLAITAYRQPVSRAEIEYVRGVDCSGVLATLLARGLVEHTPESEQPGRARIYVTTPEFLMRFGLASLTELPELGAIDGVDAAERLADLISEAPMMADAAAI